MRGWKSAVGGTISDGPAQMCVCVANEAEPDEVLVSRFSWLRESRLFAVLKAHCEFLPQKGTKSSND
jgi:hypothetical protein